MYAIQIQNNFQGVFVYINTYEQITCDPIKSRNNIVRLKILWAIKFKFVQKNKLNSSYITDTPKPADLFPGHHFSPNPSPLPLLIVHMRQI